MGTIKFPAVFDLKQIEIDHRIHEMMEVQEAPQRQSDDPPKNLLKSMRGRHEEFHQVNEQVDPRQEIENICHPLGDEALMHGIKQFRADRHNYS